MKKNQNISIVAEGSDWKLSSILEHIERITPRCVAIKDHNTNEVFWLPVASLNAAIEDFEKDDLITFRLYRKETVRGLVNCMDILHF